MNQVKPWFGILQAKRIKRGVFISDKDLIQRIEDFKTAYNKGSKPFRWVKNLREVLAKAKRSAYAI